MPTLPEDLHAVRASLVSRPNGVLGHPAGVGNSITRPPHRCACMSLVSSEQLRCCVPLPRTFRIPWPPTHRTVMHSRRNPFKNPAVFIPSALALSIAVAIGNYYVIGGLFA